MANTRVLIGVARLALCLILASMNSVTVLIH